MNKQVATYIILVILIATVAINYWPESIQQQESNLAPSTADYFFKKVSVKQFDQAGHLENQLTADKLEHFKDNQISEIIAPKIIIKNAPGTDWQVSAKKGKLNHSDNLINLAGAVLIEQSSRPTSDNKTRSTINASIITQHLSFNLNNNSAQTKDEVIITTKNTKTTAKIMIADFKNNLIELKGQTKTEGTINDSQ